ncbi:MAG: hypothetical protein L0Y71_00265 [Gemmataceae bacterium]|nr:hypothetical protein [Gemmataceae bacterium]
MRGQERLERQQGVSRLTKHRSAAQSAASMILKGDRALTLDHVRKLAERFKVSTALFVG